MELSDSQVVDYVEQIRRAGYKVTPARLAVLRAVMEGGSHLQPAQVAARAREMQPGIGRATVYRTLDLLTQLGLIRPISVADGALLFIRADEGHHHLICARCDTIIDFSECIAGDLGRRLAAQHGFHIQSHLLEFYGLCAACQRNEEESP